MLYYKLHLLCNVGRVKIHPLGKRPLCLLTTYSFRVLNLLADIKSCFIWNIAKKHIEDKTLVNRLPHRIAVKGTGQIFFRCWLWKVIRSAKQHERRVLGRSCESEVTDVLRSNPWFLKLLQQLLHGQICHASLAAQRKGSLELRSRCAGLGVMSFVYNYGEVFIFQFLVGNDSLHRIRESLNRHDNNRCHC